MNKAQEIHNQLAGMKKPCQNPHHHLVGHLNLSQCQQCNGTGEVLMFRELSEECPCLVPSWAESFKCRPCTTAEFHGGQGARSICTTCHGTGRVPKETQIGLLEITMHNTGFIIHKHWTVQQHILNISFTRVEPEEMPLNIDIGYTEVGVEDLEHLTLITYQAALKAAEAMND